jgi:hypothetical protein
MKEALESPLPSNIIKEWVWIAMEIIGWNQVARLNIDY